MVSTEEGGGGTDERRNGRKGKRRRKNGEKGRGDWRESKEREKAGKSLISSVLCDPLGVNSGVGSVASSCRGFGYIHFSLNNIFYFFWGGVWYSCISGIVITRLPAMWAQFSVLFRISFRALFNPSIFQ